MWYFQSGEFSICKPRFLLLWTTSSSWFLVFSESSCFRFLKTIYFCFVEMSIDSVFITFKDSLLPFSHISSCSRSLLIATLSWMISSNWFHKLQSLPKVLEHLKLFLDRLYSIPLSPSIQCWFAQDIHAALESIYLKINLIDASLQLNIVLRGEGMVILRCRPEIYYYHVKCIYWMSVRRTFGRDCCIISINGISRAVYCEGIVDINGE